MIKEFLQRLGLLKPSESIDHHIEYAGDNVSLTRKNYPDMNFIEEYELYSDVLWKDTICYIKGDEPTILKADVSIGEAIRLLQNGYSACK